ncbi:MAG: hypothetical protein NTZ85_01550 [Bacteroidia bacterium]|nr:hypothetical protein [Bacteroidia bacterium]
MRLFKKFVIIMTILFSCIIKESIAFPIESLTNDTIKHYVGEQFGGGIIFYVDNTNKHGLICSLSDIYDPVASSFYGKQDPTSLKGRKDSLQLINQILSISNPEKAAELCNNYLNSNYGTGQYSNWYLPTIEELEMLYRAKDLVNKSLAKYNKKVVDYLDKVYWSSSRMNDDLRGTNWLLDLESGGLITTNLPIVFVRAIRAF